MTLSQKQKKYFKRNINFGNWLKSNRLILILLIFVVVLAYANSLNNAFIADDIPGISHNKDIGNFKDYVFSNPFDIIGRFLSLLSFRVAGLNPAAFRLVNLGLHLLAVFTVYMLLGIIGKPRFAFFTSLVFAAHPVLVESVSWISGRSYILYAFFFLVSFLFYVSSDEKNYRLFSLVFFALALITSEKSVSLGLVFVAYEIYQGKLVSNWVKIIPYFLLSGLLALYLVTGAEQRISDLNIGHYQQGGYHNPLIQIPVAVASYLQLIFWPKNLTLYHSELILSQFDYLIKVVIFLFFLIALLYSFKKNRFVFFWLSFFLISLLPTLTPLRVAWVVAERYVYLGALGILAIVGLIFEKAMEKPFLRDAISVLFVLLVLLLSLRTIARNNDWKNQDNLWIATAKTSPSDPKTHNNLGDVYGRRGQLELAAQEFQIAIDLNPSYADAYHNLGNALRDLGQLDQAAAKYEKALELNPNLWQSYQNLAALYYQKGDLQKTREFLQKALEINPQNQQLRQILTQLSTPPDK